MGLPFDLHQIPMNGVTKDNRAPSAMSYLSTSGFNNLQDGMVRVEYFMRMCSNDPSELPMY